MTKEQTKAAVELVYAVAEAIRSLGSVPSGHLYSRLMGHITLDEYNHIIGVLKNTGLVTESAFVLTWTGPKLEAK